MNYRSSSASKAWSLKLQMFGLSFTALFLELMMIRWVPSIIKLIAYYANLMLLSSFLGIGLGALISSRKWRIFDWFPLFLAADIAAIVLCRHVVLGAGPSETRFGAPLPGLANYSILIGIFAMNALLFVPLGQRMGQLFDTLPRLSAYGWDLGGSLCGTLCFGIFSLKFFSPLLGIGVVMLLYLVATFPHRWLVSAPVFAGILALLLVTRERYAIWSPYYHITVTKVGLHRTEVSAPAPNLRSMRNPPIYRVAVNQLIYHYDASLNLARYTPGSINARIVASLWPQYHLPYLLCPRRNRVLVVGAGGGDDVQAALLSGARHVDAVEIDPAAIQISRRFNAASPYDDPRVTVHIDDARAFLSRTQARYDLVEFGYLDSQALFSSMSNVRLDGFVYTVEGLRTAFALVKKGGGLCLSFLAGRPWLIPKLYRMMAAATGKKPYLYLHGYNMVLYVPKYRAAPPTTVGDYHRVVFDQPPRIDPATDDWPFLYLSRQMVPTDYLIAICSLLALSIASIAVFRQGPVARPDLFFGALGVGFMLLETKSIGDCTLFFGTTWYVTTVVVAGILLMVLAANAVASRLPRFNVWIYIPLFAVLAVLYLVPREEILRFDFSGRLLWTLAVVPLPIFFAGLIFSTNFRGTVRSSSLFGANLIGAMIGGFSEYFAMAVGSHLLMLLVIAAYLASLLFILQPIAG